MWNQRHIRYGIDLGTCSTIIFQQGKGIVLHEPSLIAVRREDGGIAAVGSEAHAMLGRTSEELEVISPLKDGVIADLPMTLSMLRHFVKKLGTSPFRFMQRPEFVISVPCVIDPVKRRAVEMTTMQMGARKVTTIEGPLAAAMGSGMPVDEPLGSMVIDIGGGVIQAAIVSLGGIVVSHMSPSAGMYVDESIMEYVKNTYSLIIGKRTAELVKTSIGSAVEPDSGERMEIRGRSMINGLPQSLTLRAEEIHGLLQDYVKNIIDAIRSCLERCPPEMVGDIMMSGIMLSGGGSLLRGLDRRLQAETDVPMFVADQPIECIALGAGKLLG